MNKHNIILEAGVYDIESALIADSCGVPRLELCDNRNGGGTTPSYGMIKQVMQKATSLVNVIIRPREGNFCYTVDEFMVKKKKQHFLKWHGIAVIVVFLCISGTHAIGSEEKVICYREHMITPYILIPEKNSEIVKVAIRDLQYYLIRLTEKKIEVTSNSIRNKFPIYIGDIRSNRNLKNIAPDFEPGIDGYVLDITPKSIHIYAKSDRGIANGIYELLERMGVRWLFPGEYGEVLPKVKNTISLTVGRTIDKPVFAIREVHTPWNGDHRAWSRRNKHGCCGFGGHNSLGLWKYRKEHPEWFAEINGVRQIELDNPGNFKLCYSNDEMVKQAIANVLTALEKCKENGNPENYFIYSISPTDGGGFCKCRKCLKRGSVSDQVQNFSNKIAAAVAEKYPDMLLGYYGAYSEHKIAPVIKARNNVIVFMTTWGKNLTKELMTSENDAFRKKIEVFSKTCPKLAIRDYEFLDVWWVKGPYSLIDVHYSDYQWYHKHGVKGLLTECSDYWEGGAQSNYVMGRLWWNPYVDVEKIKRDYVKHAYGKAFTPMWHFHELINKERAFVQESTIIKLRYDLEEAARLAERDDVKTRIDLLRIHYLQLYACSELEMDRATEELMTTAFRAGLTYIHAWSATVLKRRVMPQIYRALQKLPKNEKMLKTEYPYTTSEKIILKTMADAGLKPYTEEELNQVLVKMQIPEPKTPLLQWTAGNDIKLKPLSQDKGEFEGDISINLRYLSHKFLIYVTPNEVIEITPTNRHGESPVVYKIVSPEMIEVASGEFSNQKPLLFTAGSGGIYKVSLKTIGYPSMDIKNRYVVIKASSAQQKMHPMGGLRNHYFYVPEGTKEFALVLKGDKGESYQFMLWDSSTPSMKNLLIPKKRYDNTSFMEHRIKVPDGSDGKVWKLWLSGEDIEMFIKGIPPFISNSPLRLLKKPSTLEK